MTYQPYLIANFATGVDVRQRPWLIPDDAQEELLDGYVYRGVMSKREGYQYFAYGQMGGSPYTESRIIHSLQGPLTAPMVGLINSSNTTYTFQGYAPIVPKSVIVTGSNPSQTATDTGSGTFSGAGTGTINYATGAISLTLSSAPTSGTVTVAYTNASEMTGAINGTNHVFTLALDLQIARGSVKVTGTNSSQVLTDNGLGVLSGNGTGTVNYITGAISVTFTTAPLSNSFVYATYAFMPGKPVMMIATFITATNIKQLVVADTQYINIYDATTNILVDVSPVYTFTGGPANFFSWVNYKDANGVPRLIFTNNVDVVQQWDGTSVTPYVYQMKTSAASPADVTTFTASFVAVNKYRINFYRTTENGTIYPQRIRISGKGANSDVFLTSATGAGFIDIPDQTWIQGGTANRDDFLIFTESSTWSQKYTGNDTSPFVLNKIDESRGSDATFSVITYLNRSTAVGKRGLIITDGYRVEREDELIPDFSFNNIDPENIGVCFAGVVDKDRDHYLLYPTPTNTTSNRILVTNYDEDNFAFYRLSMSCMGTALKGFTTTWNDLPQDDYDWFEFSQKFPTWNSFDFNKGASLSIGGGHSGEIWLIGQDQATDNPVQIYSVTIIDNFTLQLVTDWNNFSMTGPDGISTADFIYISTMNGMQEIQNQQFPLTAVIDNNTFNIDVRLAVTPELPTSSLSAYVSGGLASRVIPFSSTMKKFNPFVDQDKKVRCGWIYMYVDTTGTLLRSNFQISNITIDTIVIVTTAAQTNLSSNEKVTFFGIGGTTQLNGLSAIITVLTPTSFSLNNIDPAGFGAYTTGGFVGVPVRAKMDIDIITNDQPAPDIVDDDPTPFQGNMSNIIFDDDQKKWYKVFINQTGRFIQFRLRNAQAGTQINIHATMPGFQPVGRLI